MSIPADGKIANYLSSFWGYLDANFTMVPKLFLGYSQLDTTQIHEWAEFLLSGFGDQFLRGVGTRRRPTLVTNFYLRNGDGTGNNDGVRWARLHDALSEAIGNKQIPVYDNVGGNGNIEIAHINVQGWPQPIPLGWQDDFLVISDVVDLDFTEATLCE